MTVPERRGRANLPAFGGEKRRWSDATAAGQAQVRGGCVLCPSGEYREARDIPDACTSQPRGFKKGAAQRSPPLEQRRQASATSKRVEVGQSAIVRFVQRKRRTSGEAGLARLGEGALAVTGGAGSDAQRPVLSMGVRACDAELHAIDGSASRSPFSGHRR